MVGVGIRVVHKSSCGSVIDVIDELNGCRGIAVYTHSSLDKSIVHTQPELAYQEACLLEIKMRGRDLTLFGCFYREKQ